MMKRFFALFVVALMAFAGVGCNDEEALVIDTTPTLRVTCEPTINLPSSKATEGTITYEVTHPIGSVIAVAESSESWIRPQMSTSLTDKTSVEGYPVVAAKISYKIAANKGDARSATLTVRYGGYSSVELTFRQPAGEPDAEDDGEDEGDDDGDDSGDDNGDDNGDEPVTPPTPPASGEMDGKYLLVWSLDGAYKAATTVDHSSSNPYYVLTTPVTISNHTIPASGLVEAVWTVEATKKAGEYTLKGSDNKYYAMKGTHKSFNTDDGLANAELSYNWTFTSNSDGTWTILNVDKQYWIQWASSYNNVISSNASGAKPMLFKLNAAGTTFENLMPVEGGSGDGGNTDDPVTPPTPTGKTMVSGWAELPETIEKTGDYQHVFHITDGIYKNGNKARNYSACYSTQKMCAMWVAAPMHTYYAVDGGVSDRHYGQDPKIKVTQPTDWNFSSTDLTKGHMVGNADRKKSQLSNDQVSYYTNIVPQYQTYFNTGGGTWNTAEAWVDSQWKNGADTTYVVYGSHWDYTNRTKQVVNGTEIPTHYYIILLRTKNHQNKWVLTCSADELQCVALMFEHKQYSKNEVPKSSDYVSKGIAMSVADLEKKTGFVYFGNVPNAPKSTFNRSDWGL